MSETATAAVDAAALSAALVRCCDAAEAAADELNALDARLGDGDLGVTLARCAANVRGVLASAGAATPAALLKGAAQACAKASGSSFGTLLTVGLLTASRVTGDRTVLDHPTCIALLADVRQALSTRGGAQSGDKTMLDSLQAVEAALTACDPGDQAAWPIAAVLGAKQALEDFRSRPNRIGRARMFGERSIGLDDPGMVAMLRLVEAL